ncbi:APC family permease [Lactobacillus gasseri ATCC 33323 = JCM 1131]|jgi:amino acid transporter|uniref:Amino acid/polyamine/organocation transporter, APC superfamily n=2 Tax=Lactobacillus TaxID=1578 RepID=A0A805YRT0_LACGA|nr:APC family permease [Lactobacillus gasseri]ABJ61075.1 amino acid/polyamine/organocation transporter, APC superfamily [Lactobacillus gasseri ATCC 33323 = JCM 1131]KAB1919957.1 APC family permease [Lactobacillus gasseri ATCC 33323 = JCM 1131]MDG9742010.1 APC family permease [Lactobacillus gasseri ATCC 33323 = JCM 1131]MDQ4447165.1 APC family permease [Lactobacillus gasseri]STX22692.1 amino acid transporter [Lactobacillus gasseri]
MNENETSKLGFWSIVLLAINSIIGSGIFLTPGSVVQQAGSKALIVYFIAAIFASILAISFAAAAKYVTKSGAAYAYSKAAFGNNVGFYMGILRYFSASVAWGVMAVGVIKSTISIFGGNPNKTMSVTIGFLILMAVITIINLFGQKVVKYVMNLATIGKLAALVLIIVAGVVLLIMTGASSNLNEVDQITQNGQKIVPTLTTTGFVMAIVSAFYAFTGFESVASGSDDMKNPAKNLPRAIPLAIIVIAIVYIGVVAVAMMLDPKSLMTTKQVVAIAAIFKNEILRDVILVGALISMFGINVASSFNAPRILEAMARENQFSKSLTKRTKNNFPIRTFFISVLLAILIPMAFEYNMVNLITLSAMVRFLGFIVVPLAVIQFYRGKTAETVLNAQKNIWTDIVVPILSIVLVIFLLVEYNWKAQFGVVNASGQVTGINWYAIAMMIFGFIVLPLIMFFISRKDRKASK